MLDEKWNNFMVSGKISDYLDYKKTAEQSVAKAGEANGNDDTQGDSSQGISSWG